MRLMILALVVAAGVAVGTIACGDDDDGGSDNTPEPTSTSAPVGTATAGNGDGTPPSNGDCPVDGSLCDLADAIGRNLNAATVDPFFEQARPGTFTCPAPGSQGIDPLATLCEGRAEGDEVMGFPVSRLQSEGSISDEAGTRLTIQRYADEHDDIRAVTIGCPLADEVPSCADVLAVTVASEGETGRTDLLMFIFERDGRGPHLSAMLLGDGGLNPEMVSGGLGEIGLVFGERGATQFVAITD